MNRDHSITTALTAWFRVKARVLPWRTIERDPWRSLVSEFMLQQTQVDRVIEKFEPFLSLFPTPEALARASQDDVLAAWAGLGYYRRARNLHAAATSIADRFGGSVPTSVDDLLTLPGVGRYTAGAIMSLVHHEPEPIVDGNVRRVLLRLDGEDLPDAPATDRRVWSRAGALVSESGHPAAFNEGLMELGALICTPRSPKCPECPLVAMCRAHDAGTQEDIPRPKKRPNRKELFGAALIVRDDTGRLLIRRRPDVGLWAGMWEAPTLEQESHPPSAEEVSAWCGAAATPLSLRFIHQTTHRIVHFEGWTAESAPALADGRAVSGEEIGRLGISNAQRRLLRLAEVLPEA